MTPRGTPGEGRVLVLNHFAAPRGSPGGTRHVELFERLPSWDARIIAADRNYLNGSKIRSEGNLKAVRTLPYNGTTPARILNWVVYSVSAFLIGLRGERPDVVYASSPHLLAGLVGLALARIRRARFVLEIRDMWPQILVELGAIGEGSLLYRLLHGVELFLYARADAVVALSGGLRELLIERGVPASRVHVVHNGSDLEDFERPTDRDARRRRYGVEGLVFVYAGQHGPKNGLDLVLNAADEIRSESPGVSFLLVGDGSAKPDLIADAAQRRLTNVVFIDAVPKDEMAAVLGAADVGLHVIADLPLFVRGSSPNKLFDYMAAGLPVITNVPGESAAYVHSADAGIAVGPNELVHAIRQMIAATTDERALWGEAGRRYVAEAMSRTAASRLLGAVLDDVIGPRRTASN